MKNFSSSFYSVLNSEHIGQAILLAIEFVHLSSGTIVRIVDNQEDISVDGDVFNACGFSFSPPQDKEEEVRSAKITINNADQFMTSFIRSLSGEVQASIKVVTATNLAVSPKQFNNVEYSWLPVRVQSIQYDAENIEMTMIMFPISLKQFPALMFDPYNFPGLFA